MADNIYNNIYSSSRTVFLEEMGGKLESILKDKIEHIRKIGLDLLIVVSKNNLYQVIKELKDNPSLKVNSFQSIAALTNGKKIYLIINLKSFDSDFSVLLKIEMSQREIEGDYREIIEILAKFYRAVKFYKHRGKTISDRCDIKILPRNIEGLDCFDLDILMDNDLIREAYVNTEIARIIGDDYYKDLKLYNLIAYISRFDWKAGIFPEVCLCEAFEELLQLKVTERAQHIRMLLCELYRISNHIYFISNICNILQHDIAYNLSLMERERVLRIIESITGSRIVPNFIRIGGVKKDISEEIMINIRKSLPVLFRNIRGIERILINDFLFIERLKDTGIVSKEIALEYGVSGPNLRASGIRYDLRKVKDSFLYKDLSFTIPVGKSGDSLDRISVRFNEMLQSLRIINQIINKFPEGDFIKKINVSHLEFQFSEISYGIECPHGLFKMYLEVGKNNINSLLVKGPSFNSLILSEEILAGNKIEDVDLILASLDISPGEIISS